MGGRSIGWKIEERILKCNKCRKVNCPPIKFRIYEDFMPESLELLVISESPPPGEKEDYLYNLGNKDRLRSLLSKVLGIEEKGVPEFLKDRGIFWSVAVKCRPVEKKEIEGMRRNCREILKDEIQELRPKRILALGKVAEKSLRELGIQAKFDEHPLYMARFDRPGLLRLRKYLSDLELRVPKAV